MVQATGGHRAFFWNHIFLSLLTRSFIHLTHNLPFLLIAPTGLQPYGRNIVAVELGKFVAGQVGSWWTTNSAGWKQRAFNTPVIFASSLEAQNGPSPESSWQQIGLLVRYNTNSTGYSLFGTPTH
jgi:hypothetical protein